MSKKIKVLVVDDSVMMRKLITSVLSEDEDIEVIATAPNGRIALRKIPQKQPDLITLDIEMPEMNGLETLAELRKNKDNTPVIMMSALTKIGAKSTLEALALGATDYVSKTESVQQIKNELIPKIKDLFSLRVSPKTERLATRINRITRKTPKIDLRPHSIQILSIGVSTGGPNALAAIIPKLPKDFPVPIVIVQHMPPVFTKLLAERLSSKSKIVVKEGYDGAILKPGEAWIAPGNYHMVLKKVGTDVKIFTNQKPPENSCRPAADVLFRSVANIYGRNTLGLVLTGMGSDGLSGSRNIRKVGGTVYVQDKESCVVWGMPGAVAQAGLASKILTLDSISEEIIRKVCQGRA